MSIIIKRYELLHLRLLLKHRDSRMMGVIVHGSQMCKFEQARTQSNKSPSPGYVVLILL